MNNKANFSKLRDLYEGSRNTSKLSRNKGATRFLKIRSLRKSHLRNLLDEFNVNFSEDNRLWDLRRKVYESNIPISLIDNLLNEKYSEIKDKRFKDREKVVQAVKNVRNIRCGIRDDDVNTIIKRVVRNQSIETVEKLEDSIDENTLPRIKSYIVWSWYNQKTNDLVEQTILTHPKILPTLRRIKGVDFFLKTEGNEDDIPFDVKLSYIPQSFFNHIREKEGLPTEERVLKDFFKDMSETIGGRNLVELSQHILETPNLLENGGREKIKKLLEYRKDTIKSLLENPKSLCTWLYRDQGPRLFRNNNRFFVVLIDMSKFEKPWELKGEIEIIEKNVHSFLDELKKEDIYNIEYFYDKLERYRGEYKSKCCITFIGND